MNVDHDLSVYIEFLRDRISELRIKLGVSESKMSEELNYSKGYIQSITSGRSLPSMEGFLSICEYCHITPHAFWATCAETEEDNKVRRLVSYARELSNEKLDTLLIVARDINR